MLQECSDCSPAANGRSVHSIRRDSVQNRSLKFIFYEQQVISTEYLGVPLSFGCANAAFGCIWSHKTPLLNSGWHPQRSHLKTTRRAGWLEISKEGLSKAVLSSPLPIFHGARWLSAYAAHAADVRQARISTMLTWNKIHWQLFAVTEGTTLNVYQSSNIQGF